MVLEMDASNTNEVKLWMQLAYVALKQQPWVELFPSLNRDTLVLHMHSMHACMRAALHDEQELTTAKILPRIFLQVCAGQTS